MGSGGFGARVVFVGNNGRGGVSMVRKKCKKKVSSVLVCSKPRQKREMKNKTRRCLCVVTCGPPGEECDGDSSGVKMKRFGQSDF